MPIDPVTVYMFCFIGGFVFLLIVVLLGGLAGSFEFSGDVGSDVGGDTGDISGDTDGDVSAGGHAGGAIGPLSPTIIAFTICSFGGVGTVLSNMDILPAVVPAVAITIAVGLAGVVYAALNYFLGRSQCNSLFTPQDLIGSVAEVTTPIPSDGLGVVSLIARGQRTTYAAKCAEECKTGEEVVVVNAAAGLVVVKKAPQGLG